MPAGYVTDELPQGGTWRSAALDASVQVESKPGVVVVRRIIELHPGSWTKAAYAETRDALLAFTRARQQSLTLRKAP